METKKAEIILDQHTRPVGLFSHEIYDLFEPDCARYRTGLLAAIMNLVAKFRVCAQWRFNASAEQLTFGRGWGRRGV